MVELRNCLENKVLNKYEIPVCLGRNGNGEIIIKNFIKTVNLFNIYYVDYR